MCVFPATRVTSIIWPSCRSLSSMARVASAIPSFLYLRVLPVGAWLLLSLWSPCHWGGLPMAGGGSTAPTGFLCENSSMDENDILRKIRLGPLDPATRQKSQTMEPTTLCYFIIWQTMIQPSAEGAIWSCWGTAPSFALRGLAATRPSAASS